MSTEDQVVQAVIDFVYNHHSDLTPFDVIGFDEEDLERIETNKDDYMLFTVENVKIVETMVEDGDTTWYVSATLWFNVVRGERVEGSTDIYQCYRCGDRWCVEGYAS